MKFEKKKYGLAKKGWYCCEDMTIAWTQCLVSTTEENVICIDIAIEGDKYNIISKEISHCPWCGERFEVIR